LSSLQEVPALETILLMLGTFTHYGMALTLDLLPILSVGFRLSSHFVWESTSLPNIWISSLIWLSPYFI
jgi:hypothetical protein